MAVKGSQDSAFALGCDSDLSWV